MRRGFRPISEEKDLKSPKIGKNQELRNEILAKVLAFGMKLTLNFIMEKLDLLGDS